MSFKIISINLLIFICNTITSGERQFFLKSETECKNKCNEISESYKKGGVKSVFKSFVPGNCGGSCCPKGFPSEYCYNKPYLSKSCKPPCDTKEKFCSQADCDDDMQSLLTNAVYTTKLNGNDIAGEGICTCELIPL